MKKLRLLLADDHPQMLQFLRDLLSNDFCVVGTVSNGRALITAAVELQPHAIVSDIDMPVMNGLDAVRQVKALVPAVKVIFLTTHTEPEYVAAAFSAGASAFLSKTGSRDLRGRLRAVIRDLQAPRSQPFVGHPHSWQDDWPPIEKGVA